MTTATKSTAKLDFYKKITDTLDLFVSEYNTLVVGTEAGPAYIQVCALREDRSYKFWHTIGSDVWVGDHLDVNDNLTANTIFSPVSASEENPYIVACGIDRVMRFHHSIKEIAA